MKKVIAVPLNDIQRPSIWSAVQCTHYVNQFRTGTPVAPIVLTHETPGMPHKYRIKDGAHRLHAARIVGLRKINAIILET